MDTFEATKTDRFHQSLSSAWASFLGAQHCNHKVDTLRKTLEGHIHQTNLSLSSVRCDGENRHEQLVTAIAESKSRIEQHAAELKDAIAFQRNLSTLQQETSNESKDASRKVTELSKQVRTQQEGLDGLRSSTSHDIRTIQEQCRLALERVDSLQEELKEAMAQRMDFEQKVAALESQVKSITQTYNCLSEDSVRFLGEIHSRRAELIILLNKQCINVTSQGDEHSRAPINTPPPAPKRRSEEEPLELPLKRPHPSNNRSQDIRSLYLVFRDRYKTSPPKSDTAFIWEFLGCIEDPAMSKHIQDSLAAILPEHVTPSRDTRRKNPRRHIDISKGLTWRKFREALVKIPEPS
ncbi:hypothetical protein N657DRAFT_560874 [Parathielavia appendiculata]|uniref:Uncharacterized protein n=1 Tax=Parathielavia appendiculata TaxID=2587402 RepID=A0AAN6UAX3_9PEZI|nr:hypothetical protein N657DRAFT_560874 [Parathielavia appendiculata]